MWNVIAIVPNSGPCAKILTTIIQAQSTMACLNSKDIQIVNDARLKQIGFQWSQLSAFLHDRVPAYVIPTQWVALEKIPLHITKKMDRSKVLSWLSCLSDEQQYVGGFTDCAASSLDVDESVAIELSHKIAELISDRSIVGRNATLTSIGVDSIRTTSLVAFFKRRFGVLIPMQIFIDSQINIRDISRLILKAEAGVESRPMPKLDLIEEVSVLESQLIYVQRPQPHLENMFLTGATGFLGTHILQQLLHRLDVEKVIVHVRAKSLDLARRRVTTSAEAAGWPVDAFSSKFEIWIGDLAHPSILV